MAFAVRIEIIIAGLLAVATWRNNVNRMMVKSKSRQVIAIATAVSKEAEVR